MTSIGLPTNNNKFMSNLIMSDENQLEANRVQRVSFTEEECEILSKGLKIQRKVQNKPKLSPNGYMKSMTIANAEVVIEESENVE